MNIFEKLNGILGNIDLDEVTAESQQYSQLPDGYYLCEVKKAELKETKETQLPMVSFMFTVVENGVNVEFENNTMLKKELNNTANRSIFINWVLKDDLSVKRFVSDMLKFEGENEEPLLEKDCFLEAELLEESIQALIGFRVYIKISTTEKDNKSNTWSNIISWKRAKALDLA